MKGVMYLTEIDKIITEMTDEEFLKVFKNTYEEDSKVKEVTSVTNVDQRVPMERALIQIGIKLIKERRTLKNGAAIKAVGKEYFK